MKFNSGKNLFQGLSTSFISFFFLDLQNVVLFKLLSNMIVYTLLEL